MTNVLTPERETRFPEPWTTERSEVLFPLFDPLKESVFYREYKKLIGSQNTITFDKDRLDDITDKDHPVFEVYPGVKFHGYYHYEGDGKKELPADNWVVSFSYNKINKETKKLETEDRVIILRGVGYGVHWTHEGQEPSEYLIGIDIGRLDPETGEITLKDINGQVIEPNNYSIACFNNGPYPGEAVLANPQALTQLS